MTFPALILLAQIRKAQRSEGGMVWIDDENQAITTVVEGDAFSRNRRNTISLTNKWDSIDSTVEYLQSEGLLEYNQLSGYVRLNHKGYHYIQHIILTLLLHSAVAPAIVAFITTVVTLWVQSLFHSK